MRKSILVIYKPGVSIIKFQIIKHFVLPLFLLALSGCNLNSNKPKVFGVFCGECVEHCSLFIIHCEDSTMIDTTGRYFADPGAYDPYQNDILVRIPEELHREIKNADLRFKSLPLRRRTGCPDCHDQCGYYFQHGRTVWYIDPTEYPPEMNLLISAVDKLITDVRKYVFNEPG